MEKLISYKTSSACLRTRLALSRRNRTSELSANYLFKVDILLTSHSAIPKRVSIATTIPGISNLLESYQVAQDTSIEDQIA